MAEHPFYIRQTAEPEHTATKQAREEWFRQCGLEAQDEGGKWPRYSWREEPVPMLLIEVWAAKPDDEGSQRWSLQ